MTTRDNIKAKHITDISEPTVITRFSKRKNHYNKKSRLNNDDLMDVDSSDPMDIDNMDTSEPSLITQPDKFYKSISSDNILLSESQSEPMYIDEMKKKFYIDEDKIDYFDINYKLIEYDSYKLIIPDFKILMEQYELTLSNSLYLRHTYFIYFLKLLKLHAAEYNINVCYNTPSNEFSILEYININLNDYEINIQSDNYEYIYNYGQQCDVIIFPIAIFSKYSHMQHINVAIIDNYSKTIEYFEPHGTLLGIHDEIPGLVGNYLKKKFLFLQDYTYLQKDMTHQLQQSDSFCTLWSLYIIWLRVLNYKNVTTDIIEKYLLSTGYEENIYNLKIFLSLIEEIVKIRDIPYNLTIKLNNIDLLSIVPEYSDTYNVIQDLIRTRSILLKNNILNKDLSDEHLIQDLLSLSKFKDFDKIVDDVL
jgi:hypothetical protein